MDKFKLKVEKDNDVFIAEVWANDFNEARKRVARLANYEMESRLIIELLAIEESPIVSKLEMQRGL